MSSLSWSPCSFYELVRIILATLRLEKQRNFVFQSFSFQSLEHVTWNRLQVDSNVLVGMFKEIIHLNNLHAIRFLQLTLKSVYLCILSSDLTPQIFQSFIV